MNVTLLGERLVPKQERDAMGTIIEAEENGNLHIILPTGDKFNLS